MLQVACRPTCVDRGAGAAAAVGNGRTLLDFSKPKSATEGAKESPVLMDSSSGGGASGDADVVATGVVSRGEGGAAAGSDADMVVTGVVSKGEGGAGAGSFADVVATGVVNGLEECVGTSGCPGACSPTLPINSPWYWQPGGVVGGSDKPRLRVSPRGANCLSRHLEPRLCGNGGTARRHVRAVFGHQGHEGLQGFVPKHGACPPLITSDYIDHLALTQGFTCTFKQPTVQFDIPCSCNVGLLAKPLC